MPLYRVLGYRKTHTEALSERQAFLLALAVVFLGGAVALAWALWGLR